MKCRLKAWREAMEEQVRGWSQWKFEMADGSLQVCGSFGLTLSGGIRGGEVSVSPKAHGLLRVCRGAWLVGMRGRWHASGMRCEMML